MPGAYIPQSYRDRYAAKLSEAPQWEQNLLPGVANFAAEQAQPFLHPIDTARGALALGQGIGQHARQGLGFDQEQTPQMDAVSEIKQAVIDRAKQLTSREGLSQAFNADPVKTASDISSVIPWGTLGKLGAAGTAMYAASKVKVPLNTLFSIVGPTGIKNLGFERNLREAHDLAKAGHDADTIFKRTGLEKNSEGIWQLEIDDSTAKFLGWPQGAKGTQWASGPLPLKEFIDHPELFRAHPGMEDLPVHRIIADPRNLGGLAISTKTGLPTRMELNRQMQGDPFKTILHEGGHYTSAHSGMGFGGASSDLIDKAHPARPEYEKVLKELKKDKAYKGAPKMQIEAAAQREAAWRYYERLSGENRSRNIEHRADWSPLRRRTTRFTESEEFKPNEQYIQIMPQLQRDMPQVSVPEQPQLPFGQGKLPRSFPEDRYRGAQPLPLPPVFSKGQKLP